eukprot:RCo028566
MQTACRPGVCSEPPAVGEGLSITINPGPQATVPLPDLLAMLGGEPEDFSDSPASSTPGGGSAGTPVGSEEGTAPQSGDPSSSSVAPPGPSPAAPAPPMVPTLGLQVA